MFRSDNEPSILALLKDVSAGCPELEVIFRNSPQGDSRANGLAEVGVREVKNQTRVLLSELQTNYGGKINLKDTPWLLGL